MKVLLVQSMEYLYPWGGAHKANRILMEGLADRGHECRVITPSLGIVGYEDFLAEKIRNNDFEILEDQPDELFVIRRKGVKAYTVKRMFQVFPFIKKIIDEFNPDITIVSEDNTHLLLETVLETQTRTVFFAHSQATLPFGPECFQEDHSKIELYKKLDGIISVSEYLKGYFLSHAGLDSEVIYFPSYGPGPFPYLADFGNKYITVINPSAIKGLSIFIGLARQMPHLQFAAVPTWATMDEEIEEMRCVPNITIMKPAENINDIYKQTKVFLMPSLWGESFGQVVVEAMLRGIPVIASHVGGIPEAKLHLDHILPVNPIKQYSNEKVLTSSIPVPVIPEQNVEPWIEALNKLTSDEEHYHSLSQASYQKSTTFHAKLSIAAFETYFQQVINTAEQPQDDLPSDPVTLTAVRDKNNLLERINTLSPEKRKQLLAVLQERR
ncbi:glycosyltransferase involved in cell wall biosynthesis [Paenibacillus anaericanus]|uniref:glycosyltransferase family 4 protein n=1 Tax=Paenibacillus anaericanus TaxID=170367 RepID=UPI0027800704|nr:glycosyltransferase family 4 protein [Paenibacillus anaericanus]MDQ0092046.1 glycosyltransferase involved in cell wall biosynthesis [Paenibacillus anaericanus]